MLLLKSLYMVFEAAFILGPRHNDFCFEQRETMEDYLQHYVTFCKYNFSIGEAKQANL